MAGKPRHCSRKVGYDEANAGEQLSKMKLHLRHHAPTAAPPRPRSDPYLSRFFASFIKLVIHLENGNPGLQSLRLSTIETEPPDTGVEVESVGDLSDGFPLVYEPARNGEAFLIELPEFFSIAAAKFFFC